MKRNELVGCSTDPGAVMVIECGCCGNYHRFIYHGDCRDDSERFNDLEDAEKRLNMPVLEVSGDV